MELRSSRLVLMSVVLFSLSIATAGPPAESPQASSRPEGSPALRAYLDPQTNVLVSEPTRHNPNESRTHQDGHGFPPERTNPVVGGGVVMDVGTRFMMSIRGERSSTGQIKVHCEPDDEKG